MSSLQTHGSTQRKLTDGSRGAGPRVQEITRLGRYWLLRLIARGGMGEVYLAATTGIEGAERPCVVKVIRREHANDSSFLARFLDEARVQAQLQHTGVVQVIEAATDDTGNPYVVVEYVEGRSLSEVRARALQVSYRVSWPEAVAIGVSTAEALAHIHERVDAMGAPLCIVHRDISPQNIMVGYGGDIKLIDFGTARGENRRCHTVAGVVFAKPGYVAPEVANGNVGDQRVDLYALGVMIWELAVGRRFLQGDVSEHLAKVANNTCSPAPIADLIGAPPQFDAIIAKLTAFDLDKRYGYAREAARDLARLLAEAPCLSNGERSIKTRISQLMGTLYPMEPTQSRRSFVKLVSQARHLEKRAKQVEQVQPAPAATTQPGHSSIGVRGASSPSIADEIHAAGPNPIRQPHAHDAKLLPGTNYRVIKPIGKGAMGSVLEAEHVELGRRVALKVLNADATTPDHVARFRREARSLSRITHPNLVTIHDFGQALDGRLYCAMELLDGEPLDAYLSRRGRLPWKEVLKIGAQAASALAKAHQAQVIHRDIKPSNLFLCNDGCLKILDFGLAKKHNETMRPHADAFALFGTPEYMAPEQVGSGDVDGRADVYALACVMFQMLTGHLPIEAPATVALLEAKTRQDPVFPDQESLVRDVPQQVKQIVLKALAREPSRRTDSAETLLAQLNAALNAPYEQRRRRRHNARIAIALSLGTVAIAMTVAAARTYPEQTRSFVEAVITHPVAGHNTPAVDFAPSLQK